MGLSWILALELLLAGFLSRAFADKPLICQQDWQFPVFPDNTTTVLVGQNYKLQWDSNLITWFADWCKPCGDGTNVDLWVQTGHNEDSAYKIASGVNVKATLSYPWTVNVGVRNATEDSVWVLRFIKYNATPNNISGDSISSPLFKVKVPTALQSSSSTSPGSTASSTSTASSSTSPAAPEKGGLSTAAQAGIGAGVGVAAILALASYCYFFARNRKRKQREEAGWHGQMINKEKDQSHMYKVAPGYAEPGQYSDWTTPPYGKSTSHAEMSSEIYRSELPVNERASELSIDRRI